MPYVSDGYTKYIYPLKLHEYLAAGIPVVGTPIRTLCEFPDLVQLAGIPDEWSAVIECAFAPEARSDAAINARKATARAHDWDLLADRIAGLIERRLST